MAVGLRWHYDVTGAEPIVRDVRVYNSGALQKGTAMCGGAVATVENNGCAIVVTGNVLSNIIGVLQEDMTAAQCLGVVATGVDKYAKLIINPFAVWLGQYSEHADDDVPITSADTSGKTCTVTQVTNHTRAWAYCLVKGTSAATGSGNLFQTGAITTTTVLTAATDYDDALLGNTTSDLVIVLPAPFNADVAGGSVDLSDASGIKGMQIAGYSGTAGAGAAIILENYIESPKRSLQPLVCATHSGKNYVDENPKFFGDIMFSEHLLACGGVVNTRVIT
jgi:hypothetical protein